MITIEDKKRLAEWMGWTLSCGGEKYLWSYHTKDGPWQYFNKFTPEKGGKDLTKVLKKLNKWEWSELLHFELSGMNTVMDFEDIATYFQDNKNAETIIKAILEMIK